MAVLLQVLKGGVVEALQSPAGIQGAGWMGQEAGEAGSACTAAAPSVGACDTGRRMICQLVEDTLLSESL